MQITLMLAIIVSIAVANLPANAQQKTQDECLDVVSKYIEVLTGTLRETKPTGACPLARWAKTRHEEILRMYNAEPAECRTSDLGKNLERTLKARISQEDRLSKRHCLRN